MVRIAVCDDDMRFTAELEEMVRREADDSGISVETDAYYLFNEEMEWKKKNLILL